MNNSAFAMRNVPDQKSGISRYGSVAFVAGLHVAAILALANGLVTKFGPPPPPPIEIRLIDKLIPQQALPLPNPTMTKIPPATSIPEPFIPIAPDPAATPMQTSPQSQPQHPSQTATADVAASGLSGTHTTPPYPALARRLGQRGVVVLSLAVSADGTVAGAQVATSSGVPELDQAAVSWVTMHWRYKPALHAGAPVSSSVKAAVRFDLKDVN